MQLRKEAWKKFRTSTGFEPVTSRCRCDALTNWAMKPLTLGAGQLWVHMFPWKRWVLMIYEINNIWTAEMKWKWRKDCRSSRNLCNSLGEVTAHETPRQNVYACASLSISGLFFSRLLVTFQSDQSLPRTLGFTLCAACAACGSVVLLHAARVFDYFVVIEIAFMDNQAQITETISRLDSEKVSW